MLAANRAIAFDFDGTLVDSAPGILRGISLALATNRVRPVLPLDRRLIGPPLPVTLAKVAGRDDPDLLEALLGDFMRFYDGGTSLDSPAFPGIGETLVALRQCGQDLYLVTNKRGIPTRKMLDHLRWSALFKAVYCLDEHRECPSKVELLAKTIAAHSLGATDTPYVGDTDGDARAARANGMPYIHVAWGYGDLPDPRPERVCTDPGEWLSLTGPTLRSR